MAGRIEKEGLSFGEAIEALKVGRLVTRNDWEYKGRFLFIRPEDELSINFIVDKVKSLPPAVKEWYDNSAFESNSRRPLDRDADLVKFKPYICMKEADGAILNGWVPSQDDMLAEDWVIFEPRV